MASTNAIGGTSGTMDSVAAIPQRGFRQTHIVWSTAAFLLLMHLLAAYAVVHLVLSFSWWTLLLGAVWYLLCGFSITAGYHRLFAHRSFRASRLTRALLLAFGAAAWERSALCWCADHRIHHRQCDGDADPYSVQHGFWWAHFGWVISDASVRNEGTPVPSDLHADPLVYWQSRYWVPLALVFGTLIPFGLGFLWGDALGAFLVAGCLRVVVMWHATYSVNSFAHRFGRRTYSTKDSGRDNGWIALATLGEGYHNFHHRFQSDYRNGIRWFHYDPTKWLIWTLSLFGLSRGLVRIPQHVIANARDGARSGSVR